MFPSTFLSLATLIAADIAGFAFAQTPSITASSSTVISASFPLETFESSSEASMPQCWNSCFSQYQVTSEYALCEAPLKTEITSCITTSCTQADNSTAITAFNSWLSNYCGIPFTSAPAQSASANQQAQSSSTVWWTPSATAEQTAPPAESSAPAQSIWWTPSSSVPLVPDSSAAAQNTWWTPSSAVSVIAVTSVAPDWSSPAVTVGVTSVSAYSDSTWTTSAQTATLTGVATRNTAETATVPTETSAGFSQETGYVNAGSGRTLGASLALFGGIFVGIFM